MRRMPHADDEAVLQFDHEPVCEPDVRAMAEPRGCIADRPGG